MVRRKLCLDPTQVSDQRLADETEGLRSGARPMPARINVYCRCADMRPDPQALLDEIKAADLMTLAEDLNLPEGEEAAVEAIWPHLGSSLSTAGLRCNGSLTAA